MSNRQILEQAVLSFTDPLKRHQYFALYSADIVLHGYPGVEPGLRSVKGFYKRFWQVFPDAKVTVQDMIEEGDTIAIRYVITGTQREVFMGVPATGRQIELPGISILRFKEGRCFERWGGSDSMVLLNQIGQSEVK